MSQIVRSRPMQSQSAAIPLSTWMLTAFWCGAVALCMIAMAKYETTSGEMTAETGDWPANELIAPKQNHWTLVMFAHPRCPCTRASLEEFANVLESATTSVQAVVVFYSPANQDAAWEQSASRKAVEKMAGVRIVNDLNGALANQFRAQCSGMTYLYDPAGHLRFSGGITAGRGHQGENAGRALLASLLQQTSQSPTVESKSPSWPVYGCSILSTDAGL